MFYIEGNLKKFRCTCKHSTVRSFFLLSKKKINKHIACKSPPLSLTQFKELCWLDLDDWTWLLKKSLTNVFHIFNKKSINRALRPSKWFGRHWRLKHKNLVATLKIWSPHFHIINKKNIKYSFGVIKNSTNRLIS